MIHRVGPPWRRGEAEKAGGRACAAVCGSRNRSYLWSVPRGEARPWGLLSDALISLFAPDRVIRRARKARHVRPPPVRRASSASRHMPRVPPTTTCRHVGEKPDSMHTRCLIYIYILYSWNIFGRYDFEMNALACDKSNWKCRARLWKILNAEWITIYYFLNFSETFWVFIKFCQGKFLRLFDLEKRKKEEDVSRKLRHEYVNTVYIRESKSWSVGREQCEVVRLLPSDPWIPTWHWPASWWISTVTWGACSSWH